MLSVTIIAVTEKGKNKMRDRLIELLEEAHDSWLRYVDECAFNQMALSFSFEQMVAEHLLANGIVVPPCKVGQTVYVIDTAKEEIVERKVTEIRQNEWETVYIHSFGFGYPESLLGKTVFITKEQAEKALAERSEQQ